MIKLKNREEKKFFFLFQSESIAIWSEKKGMFSKKRMNIFKFFFLDFRILAFLTDYLDLPKKLQRLESSSRSSSVRV